MIKALDHSNRCFVCNKKIDHFYECNDEKCSFCRTVLVCSEECHKSAHTEESIDIRTNETILADIVNIMKEKPLSKYSKYYMSEWFNISEKRAEKILESLVSSNPNIKKIKWKHIGLGLKNAWIYYWDDLTWI